MLAYEDPGQALRTRRKQLKQQLRESRSAQALAALQARLLAELEDGQQQVLERAGYTLPCRAGCDLCCHLRVEPFAHELLVLLDALTTLPEAQAALIRERVARNAARIGAMSEAEHLVTNIPCAFLDQGRCSVHGRRPLSCARYHSTDLPACQRAHDDPAAHGDSRPVIPEVDLEGDVLIQAMRDALKQGGLDHRRYEMNTALAALLEAPSLAQRWRQGKPLVGTGRA